MSDLDTLIPKWNKATANLPWGVQHQFYQTLKLVEDEKIHLVHGADYAGNMPCLVNANAQVLGILEGEGGTGKPSRYFGEVVSTFDSINSIMKENLGYDGNYVDSVTATLLLQHFGPLKSEDQGAKEAHENEMKDVALGPAAVYKEPTDAELMGDWMKAITEEAPDAAEENVSSEQAIRND